MEAEPASASVAQNRQLETAQIRFGPSMALPPARRSKRSKEKRDKEKRDSGRKAKCVGENGKVNGKSERRADRHGQPAISENVKVGARK